MEGTHSGKIRARVFSFFFVLVTALCCIFNLSIIFSPRRVPHFPGGVLVSCQEIPFEWATFFV